MPEVRTMTRRRKRKSDRRSATMKRKRGKRGT
jgi:hypothetical protein